MGIEPRLPLMEMETQQSRTTVEQAMFTYILQFDPVYCKLRLFLLAGDNGELMPIVYRLFNWHILKLCSILIFS